MSEKLCKVSVTNVEYSIYRPAGNDTAFVYGLGYTQKQRKKINDLIMAKHPNVEQVGFIELNPKPELQMAGGEFCGNATRSAASIFLNGKPGDLQMFVNSKDLINAGVDKEGKAWCEIPLYHGDDVITEKEPGIFIVKMNGMVTVVIQDEIAKKYLVNKDILKAMGMNFIHKYHLEYSEAVGVMFCENVEGVIKINPVVWVKEINTLFYETACGSGTTATCMVEAYLKKQSVKIDILQPSGLIITADIIYDEGSFKKATILGNVETDGKTYQIEGGIIMKGKVQPKTLPGFMELLPKEQILFNKMKEIIKKSYEKYGFLPLDTPIIEDANVLLAKAGGETEKQIYKLKKGENDLALRFDLTVPLAKYVTEYYDKLNFPFKRYQIGKVYRGEKPQRGRYREFYQCDVDIIGDGELSIINDAEIPSIIYNTFKKLGFDDFTICINNRKILNGLFSSLELEDISPEILRIIDKIEKIGKEEVRRELLISIPEKKVDVIMQFLEIKGKNEEKIQALESMNIDNAIFKEGINEIKEVSKFIKIFGVPEENYKIDLTIARGLDYYTGTVYETFLNQYKNLGSICSGGRYDNLTEYYTERKMPGVGISIGLSRLFFQLVDNKIISANEESITDVLIISMTEDCEMCAKIASKLREEDINVQINIEQQKLGKKFKYANNINARYVIIIGEDEIKNNVLTLKDMSSGEQSTITLEETIVVVQKAKNKD